MAQDDVCRVLGDRSSNYYPWGQLFFPSAVRGLEFILRPWLLLSKEQPRALLSLIPPKAGSLRWGSCSLHPSPLEEMFSSFKYARELGPGGTGWVEC